MCFVCVYMCKCVHTPTKYVACLVDQMVKNLPAMQETGFNPSVGKIPWRREWLPTAVFLPGEFHGQRSLAGHSPRGCKATEQLALSLFSYVCCCCCCCVASVVSDSVRPHRRQPTRPPVPGILQARTLEWVAISFSNA